ncbi:membrane lipoprotein lipid attachment site-containing protein [Spirochaeta isovalerica]|uniref:Lipoprotein n=1 Tax=Spirochaeta isovalerica TaxID=150 RepID=A0A841RDP9_9SPIO|nr:membrane lipoprotein lipid attachment site-containing protein [Spirochaeta isovalerica]MBB6482175.1 hypothetical protein [Spirochaeta isovalerica]
MKKLLLFLISTLMLAACATAPDTASSEDEAENRGILAAEKGYYLLDDERIVEKLDSAEYKMLINLEDYSPEILWDLMKEAAAETGVVIEEFEEPMKRNYRDIQYLDTDYGMVKNLGYILRYRFPWDVYEGPGAAANERDSKYDITIKVRDSDMNKAISVPLSVGEEFADIEKSPELEADISPYGMKFAWAIKVKPKTKDFGPFEDLFEPTLESFSRLYPQVLNTGLPPETVIGPVAGKTILEEKVEPALMFLSCGTEMEVAFSTFFMDGEKLVTEASFDFDTVFDKVDENGNEVEYKMTLEDFRQVEEFYKVILQKYNNRIDFGWSKTQFVYDTLFPDASAE